MDNIEYIKRVVHSVETMDALGNVFADNLEERELEAISNMKDLLVYIIVNSPELMEEAGVKWPNFESSSSQWHMGEDEA